LKAIHHFENACSIFPYSFNYYFDLGRSYILAQNFKKAYISFEKAHQIVPKNILALEELVKTAFDLKMKNETVYYGRKYLSIAPN
ncbi:tetratricopeptide repeat protein, partial [Streptococcus pneumoniae]|uniref:tetratricopeptide repeat protein n=1 Tax=Streptococcus pneumoniae TaxID=1313 RepID=UPI0012D841AE